MFVTDLSRNDLLLEKLNLQFPNSVISSEFIVDMIVVTLKKDQISDILKFLKDDPELQYNFLTTLCGIHLPESELPLGVIYHLHSFEFNHRIRIKSFTSSDNPVFPTATKIWLTANWMERETWEFFGIKFEGHPNLVRILNVDDFDGFPLRKDFPLEDQTREDKNDKMFGRES